MSIVLSENILSFSFILFSVIGLYFAFYSPIVINYFVTYSWQFYGLLIFEIVMTSNGIATPLVYAWHSETFKQKMLEMYGLRKLQTSKVTRTPMSTISSCSRSFNDNRSTQQTHSSQYKCASWIVMLVYYWNNFIFNIRNAYFSVSMIL